MGQPTQEQVREIFDYDSENGWLIRKQTRAGIPWNKPCGHKPSNSVGYGQVVIDYKLYYSHRIIWLWHYGEWPDGEIDHKDQNKMNNRIENLRVVSSSESKQNLRLKRNNTTGYPGVSWYKPGKKYRVHITVDMKQIFIGIFDTLEEASVAYMTAKIQYHPTSPIAQEYLRELTLAG